MAAMRPERTAGIGQGDACPPISMPEIGVRAVVDHLHLPGALAKAQLAVTEFHERSRRAVGGEQRLRHAGPARGKVGHPVAAPDGSLGQR